MTVHHSDPWLTIHGGDCRDVLATLPAESVHCVVTSPPYWGLRDYGVTGQLGLEPTPEEYVADMVAVFAAVRRVLRPDGTCWLNLGDSYAGSRMGPPGGPSEASTLRGNGQVGGGPKLRGRVASRRRDDAEMPRSDYAIPGLKPKDLVGIPWRVAFALQADGWYLRSDIIWAKPNPMPESVTDRPTKSHEYLFLLTKSGRYWYDADAVAEETTDPEYRERGKVRPSLDAHFRSDPEKGRTKAGLAKQVGGRTTRNRRSIWTVPTQPYPGAHFAVMPEALVEPCILAGCPDQACSECGAPWERVVERHGGERYATGKSATKNGAGLATAFSGYKDGSSAPTFVTTGWKPTCAHDAPTVPGVALDPFGGSGTVARVANRLSRRAVLIDLNPDYLEQQMVRNAQTPMGLTA